MNKKRKIFMYILIILGIIVLLSPSVRAVTRLNYDDLCAGTEPNGGMRQAMIILGYVIDIIKIVVPLLIMVLGMLDFGKAIVSNDEKAINKAAASLGRRLLAGILIFFLPGLIMSLLDVVGLDLGEYETCYNCVRYPGNDCVKPVN